MSHKSATHKSVTPAAHRIQVRRSGIHGRGVFALQDIPRGTRIIEYLGEIISWDEAQRRHPHDPQDPNHTFYFHIDDDRVIDALYGGNDSRWINHSCNPNCRADERGGRIFIVARRHIKTGEELNYDYGLVIDEPLTPELMADYPCRCGSANCRGTLLSSGSDSAAPIASGKTAQPSVNKKQAPKKQAAPKSADEKPARPKKAGSRPARTSQAKTGQTTGNRQVGTATQPLRRTRATLP